MTELKPRLASLQTQAEARREQLSVDLLRLDTASQPHLRRWDDPRGDAYRHEHHLRLLSLGEEIKRGMAFGPETLAQLALALQRAAEGLGESARHEFALEEAAEESTATSEKALSEAQSATAMAQDLRASAHRLLDTLFSVGAPPL